MAVHSREESGELSPDRDSSEGAANSDRHVPNWRQNTVFNVLDRQLFNIDLSSAEFRKMARDLEQKSLEKKRKCRIHLKNGRQHNAWEAAEEAIKARNEAFIYNHAFQKLSQFYKMVSNNVNFPLFLITVGFQASGESEVIRVMRPLS